MHFQIILVAVLVLDEVVCFTVI